MTDPKDRTERPSATEAVQLLFVRHEKFHSGVREGSAAFLGKRAPGGAGSDRYLDAVRVHLVDTSEPVD